MRFRTPRDLEHEITRRLDDFDALGELLLQPDLEAYVAEVLNDYLLHPRDSTMIGRDDVGDDLAVLLRTGRFVFSIERRLALPKTIHTAVTASLSRLIGEHPIEIREYTIEKPVDLDVFEPGVALIGPLCRRHDGRPIVIAGGTPRIVEFASRGPILEMKIARRPGERHQFWHFNRSTLRSEFPSVASVDLTGQVMLSRVLGSLRERRALPYLDRLCGHPAHVVRWSAIQAIGRLDAGLARRKLGEAVDDPHPHIRQSARSTLARIGGVAA